MPDKITVYFNNDYRAVFNIDDVTMVYTVDGSVQSINGSVFNSIKNGRVVVNWSNVCFIKPHVEEVDEDA